MLDQDEKYLKEVARREGFFDYSFKKKSFQNPLENSYWNNLIDGALKGLEVVSIASFDYKLVAIVKLLQSWISDKREELAKAKQQREYGFQQDNAFGYQYKFSAEKKSKE